MCVLHEYIRLLLDKCLLSPHKLYSFLNAFMQYSNMHIWYVCMYVFIPDYVKQMIHFAL